MTAIVLNTATGAVSEYDWTFQSITASHAGSAAGLFTLGGGTDNGAPITGQVLSGKPGGEKMLCLGNVYLTIDGSGEGVLIVQGRTGSWEYPVAERTSGIARAKPGRGIRESRLAFGYRNVDGADFRLDRIAAEVTQSTTRRV
jgi:hypothetical protein